MIDVVVLNYNDCLTTEKYVKKIAEYNIISRIVIVDNCSTDDSYNQLTKLINQSVYLIKTIKNLGYGAGNNVGVKYLWENFKSSHILISNPDVFVEENTLRHLQDFLNKHNNFAIAAPFMLDKHGNKETSTAWKIPTCWEYIFSMGMILGKIKTVQYKDILTNKRKYMKVGAVAGSLFLVKTESFIKTGMFDERIFLYGEETVIGIKMKKIGMKIALLMNDFFIHNHASSTNKAFKSEIRKKKIQMKSKMFVLNHYYNPSFIQYSAGWVFSKIYICEIALWNMLKNK